MILILNEIEIMKHIRFIVASILLSVLFLSCKKEKITGSGNIITEPRNVSNFYSVSAFGSSEVYITYGTQFSVSVNGYENIVPELKTYVEDGTLIIKYDNNVNITNDNSKVYVTMPSLVGVSGNGDNDIKVSGNFIGMENLSATTSGSGDIKIESGQADNLVLKISGSGDISAFGLSSKNATVNINGSGDAEVSVSQKLKANISGSGNIYYKGNPTIDASISGSGKVIKN